MKNKHNGLNLLTNKYVLHTVFAITLINILCLMTFGNFEGIILFAFTSVIIANFSRNMIVVLGISLIVVNLFALKKSCFPIIRHEGFEGADDSDSDNESVASTDTTKKASKAAKAKKATKAKQSSNDDTNDTESFVDNNTKNNNTKKTNKIDYASTVEEAYDNLNKMIGSEGIQNLTKDTQRLVTQQESLAKAMESMAPMIENMGPLLDRAKGILGDGGMEGIANMAKRMTAKNN